MATEYISREAALACFCDWIDRYGHEHSADEITEYQRIEDLPVADVRPVVRAVWIPVSERWHEYPFYKCSSCGAKSGFSSRFCPNCGADTRGETDGN